MVEETKAKAKSTTSSSSTTSSAKDRRSRSTSPRPPSGSSNKRGTSPLPKNRHRSKTPPPSVRIPPPPKPKAVPPYLGMSLEEAVSTLPLTRVQEYQDDDDFLAAVQRCVPSEFVLLASQDEISKAQEDYVAMEHYQLPPPDGHKRWLNSELAGSVATCALLQLLYQYPDKWVAGHGEPFSTLEILQELQERIQKCSHIGANPTLSSSRPLGPPRLDEGVYAPYYIVPPKYVKGTRRALLIGCVTGEGKDLKGPLNDICNIRRFLVDHAGFPPENIVLLQDSPKVPPEQRPTKKNILQGFVTLIKQSKPNDVNFIQFSGHGNRDYQNLYIMPCDYQKNGCIVDDQILNQLIKAMPAQVYTTFLVDCCYSGTVGELPYILKASTSTGEQELQSNFDTTALLATPTEPQPKAKPKPRPSQSIEKFYDMDTQQEVMEKETKGDEENKVLQKARKLKRQLLRFDPIKLIELVAATSKDAAEKLDKGISKAVGKLSNNKDKDKKDNATKDIKNTKKDKDKEAVHLQSNATPMRRVKLADGTYTNTPVRDKSPKRPAT